MARLCENRGGSVRVVRGCEDWFDLFFTYFFMLHPTKCSKIEDPTTTKTRCVLSTAGGENGGEGGRGSLRNSDIAATATAKKEETAMGRCFVFKVGSLLLPLMVMAELETERFVLLEDWPFCTADRLL